eukprot:1444430-Prymnesium_polylepis.1
MDPPHGPSVTLARLMCSSGGSDGNDPSSSDATIAAVSSSAVKAGDELSSSASTTPRNLPQGRMRSTHASAMAWKLASVALNTLSRVRIRLLSARARFQQFSRLTGSTSIRLRSCF